MLVFLLQLRDTLVAHRVYLFSIFVLLVWVVWFRKWTLSRRYQPFTGTVDATTSVIIPVVDEPEALFREVKSVGIHVTNGEPSGFRTKWNNASAVHSEPSEPYAPIYARFDGMNQNSVAGDPVRAAAALLRLVDEETPPLRLLMGNMAYDTALRTYDQRLETWKAWEQVSRETDFPDSE